MQLFRSRSSGKAAVDLHLMGILVEELCDVLMSQTMVVLEEREGGADE